MLVRPNADGTYSATWTPAAIGCYSIVVNIDGYEMEEVCCFHIPLFPTEIPFVRHSK